MKHRPPPRSLVTTGCRERALVVRARSQERAPSAEPTGATIGKILFPAYAGAGSHWHQRAFNTTVPRWTPARGCRGERSRLLVELIVRVWCAAAGSPRRASSTSFEGRRVEGARSGRGMGGRYCSAARARGRPRLAPPACARR